MGPLSVLRIDGQVEAPADFTFDVLCQLPAEVQTRVEEHFPGKAGQAVWVRALLSQVQPGEGSARVKVEAVDERFSNTLTLEDTLARGILCYGADGGPLPTTSGGPFRFYLVGSRDSCDHVKAVACLRVLAEDQATLGQWRKPRHVSLRPRPTGAMVPTVLRSEVQRDGMTLVEVEGEKLVLALVSGHVVAFSPICPHLGASFVEEGSLTGARLTCTRHGRHFDVFDGRCTSHAGEGGLTLHHVQIVDGRVFVQRGGA